MIARCHLLTALVASFFRALWSNGSCNGALTLLWQFSYAGKMRCVRQLLLTKQTQFAWQHDLQMLRPIRDIASRLWNFKGEFPALNHAYCPFSAGRPSTKINFKKYAKNEYRKLTCWLNFWSVNASISTDDFHLMKHLIKLYIAVTNYKIQQ